MPATKLWGVSTKGNVYALSTDGSAWQQVWTLSAVTYPYKYFPMY